MQVRKLLLIPLLATLVACQSPPEVSSDPEPTPDASQAPEPSGSVFVPPSSKPSNPPLIKGEVSIEIIESDIDFTPDTDSLIGSCGYRYEGVGPDGVSWTVESDTPDEKLKKEALLAGVIFRVTDTTQNWQLSVTDRDADGQIAPEILLITQMDRPLEQRITFVRDDAVSTAISIDYKQLLVEATGLALRAIAGVDRLILNFTFSCES